jgi:putative membrane protein
LLILFLAIVVGVVVLLVRWLGGSEHPLFRPTGQTSRTGLDILKERLAKGEIDVAEFEERKRALSD